MNIILIAAVIVFVIYRQFQTRSVTGRGLVILPLILIGLGLQNISATPPVGALAIGALAIDVAIGLVLGALRGRSQQVWQDETGAWWRRGTRMTAVLWVASIAARAAVVLGASAIGAHGATAAGPLELAFGASLGAQFAVIALRAGLLDATSIARTAPDPR